MGMRETIQNRLTNQSAAWAALMLVLAPVAQQFDVYVPLPVTNIGFVVALVIVILVFIRSDKNQEHHRANAVITNPKYLEQFLDRYAVITRSFSEAVIAAKNKLGG